MNLESATGARPRNPFDLHPWRETRLTLTVEQVPPDVTLLDAQLSRGGGSPCVSEDNIRDNIRVRPSGFTSSTAPLEANERLTLALGGFQVLQEESPRLDLLLQTHEGHLRCVPLPLTDEGRPLRWRTDQHLALGIAAEVEEFTTPLGSVIQVGAFPLLVGWWFGPYRAELAAGVALAGCPTNRCPVMSKDSNINDSTTFLIAPGVGRAFFEGGYFSVGATVRYRVVHLMANTFHGQEQLWMHGPIVIPYVGIVSNPKVGAGEVGGAREVLFGIEFLVGYAFAENGERAPSLGLGLTLVGAAL